MAKLTTTDITAGYSSATAYNNNNALIEAAVENTLSRDGTTPNTMGADIDLNSHDLNNVGTVNTTALMLNGSSLSTTNISSVNGTTYKNKIINGSLDIWQRGTSFTSIATGAYSVDRFKYYKQGAVVHTITKQGANNPESLTNPLYANYIRLDTTTADASLTSGDYSQIMTIIEGANTIDLQQGLPTAKTVTLSFWHAHTELGTYSVAFRNYVDSRTYLANYTQLAANTWEKATITLTLDTTGAWLTDAGVGLKVAFTIATGSTFQGTADTWQAGNFFASTTATANGAAATNDYFRIGQVQLEIGTAATGFEARSIGTELALCQRYFYTYKGGSGAYADSTTTVATAFSYPMPMRAIPTASVTALTASIYRTGTVTVSQSSIGLAPTSDRTTLASNIIFANFTGLTAGEGLVLRGQTSSILDMDAEL